MKSLRNLKDLRNKRALLRVDFNIDMDERGEILDDFRIRAVLPTIKYLLDKKAKIIILSHLGRPTGRPILKSKIKNKKSKLQCKIQNEKYSLRPIAKYLENLLKRKVKFLPDCIGEKVEKEVGKMKDGGIAMLENLRFYEGEEKNDAEFAKSLAKLGDVYVNDAFGVSHRANASVAAITKYLPFYAGLLLEKEIENLSKILKNPESPCVLVLGGAKIETKLPVLNYLKNKADKILIGGVVANVFLKALGFEIGKSKSEEGYGKDIEEIMKSDKIILPQDVRTESGIKETGDVGKEEKILDIGPKTAKLFGHFIKEAKTVIWNGPMGFIEDKRFIKSSIKIVNFIAKNKNFTIVGGGETLIVLNKAGVFDKIKFVSTGGGAMLEFLAGKKLPGIEALE